MKKALALVLALVLALSMAVSAFAADVIVLQPVPASTTGRIPVAYNDFNYGTTGKADLFAYKGGTYYFGINGDHKLKDITLTPNGNVTAELVNYDPAKYDADGEVNFYVYNTTTKMYLLNDAATWNASTEKATVTTDNKTHTEPAENFEWDLYYNNADDTVIGAYEAAKALNDVAEAKTWVVVPTTNVYIVKFVVANNYSAAYTKGTIKIDAYDTVLKKNVTNTLTVINDVVIFEYEQVKYAAESYDEGYALLTNNAETKGYSDYETSVLGYDLTGNVNYRYDELRNISHPYVVSTTAFRAITGESLCVSTPGYGFTVDIEAVQAGQKGVNFRWYKYIYRNAAGLDTSLATTLDKHVKSVDFGFYGDQIVKGDFVVTATPGISWFQLRELFEVKVEEDDIISYYLLKDGKVVKEYKIDYMTIDPDEKVEIELELKDTTLGQYTLALEVPAAGEATESNPNTGAESVVGVVAALAVVSLASAAAVSLKK